MKTLDRDALSDLVIRALERTAMVLAEPVITDRKHPPATRFARIQYDGPCRGSLTLGADDQFLRDLASSLMGLEPSEVTVEVEGSDALKELANIVGGSVIVTMSGEVCKASLGLPELVGDAHTSLALSEMPAPSCTIAADAGVLYVWLTQDVLAKSA